MNDAKWSGPRCGAKRKRDGQPCELPAMANGRCHRHGGCTPRGDQWHVPQLPKRRSRVAEQKYARKLKDRERLEHKRRLRIANMSPEQKAAYDAWQKIYRPGSASRRAFGRYQRTAAANIQRLLSEPHARSSEELEINEALERARAELAFIEILNEPGGLFS